MIKVVSLYLYDDVCAGMGSGEDFCCELLSTITMNCTASSAAATTVHAASTEQHWQNEILIVIAKLSFGEIGIFGTILLSVSFRTSNN